MNEVIILAKKKQSIVKKRITRDILNVEGFLSLDKLEGFCVNFEEDGLKDVTSDLKELNGQYVKINISVVNEEDLSSIGFTSIEE